jgi:glycosyltransferase involved in cell wall biosynthesis
MEKMGRNAKRLVQEEFSWDKISDSLEVLYYRAFEK